MVNLLGERVCYPWYGGGGGAGRPVPIGGGVGCSIFTPIWFGDGGGCMKAGAGTGILKPVPDPPRCHV